MSIISDESPLGDLNEGLDGDVEDEAGRTGIVDSDDTSTSDTRSGYLVGRGSEVSPVLSVVMPTLNEEEGVGECIDRIERAVATLGVPAEIVVSDSSVDGTPEVAKNRGAIVIEPDQPGYGYAYRYAFERVRGEYVVMADADTTYDFEEIPRLLRTLRSENADMVMGSRLNDNIEPDAMPLLHRYIGNPLLTRFLNTFYDAGVSDAHSGFRAFRREWIDDLDLRTDGMEFASEMIMVASVRDFDIEEVSITYHEREGEETLDSFRDGWRHVKFMLLNAPGYVFSAPGVLFALLGIVTMVLSLTGTRLAGIAFGTHTIIAGSLLTIVGYQIANLAVFSLVAADPVRSPEDPLTEWIVEHLNLEQGILTGGMFFGVGAAYVAGMVYRWTISSFTVLPFLNLNMVAFTAIIIGIQTIFSAFFLGMSFQKESGLAE
jgi:glycosyltransferase involved in cell wall biosynthesis